MGTRTRTPPHPLHARTLVVSAQICIYANHLLRAAYPTMLETAESILTHSRSLEIDGKLLPVKKILTLIDENPLNPSEKKEKV